MASDKELFDAYPPWMVVASNALSISIYLMGAYLLSGFGVAAVAVYLIFCLWMEARVISCHCVNCAYFGKLCCFGKGKISSAFFKQGDPKKFSQMSITWRDMLPDLMVPLIPVIGGIILLIKKFDWTALAAVMLIFILSFAGNALVRGRLACRHCRQRVLGCPAERLFNKKKGQ
jgi:hypothetical protein